MGASNKHSGSFDVLFGGQEKASVFAWMDGVRSAISNGARPPQFLHKHEYPPFVPPSMERMLRQRKPSSMLLKELEAFACGAASGGGF